MVLQNRRLTAAAPPVNGPALFGFQKVARFGHKWSQGFKASILAVQCVQCVQHQTMDLPYHFKDTFIFITIQPNVAQSHDGCLQVPRCQSRVSPEEAFQLLKPPSRHAREVRQGIEGKPG